MKFSACTWPLLLVLAAVPAAASGSRTAAEADASDEPLLVYTAPLRQVTLSSDFRLADAEDLAEYDNPAAAEPSKTVRTEKTARVSEEETAELLRFIKASGFHALQEEYGAKAQERHYAYIIAVRDGDGEKRVTYRSSPEAAPRPEAFARAETRILEFTQKAFASNKGE